MSVQSAAAAVAVIGLSIGLWRVWQPESSLAGFCLLPLVVIVFAGTYRVRSQRNRALSLITLLDTSPLKRFLRGRVSAVISGALVAGVVVPVIAAQAVLADRDELALLVLTGLAAFPVYLATVRIAQGHFKRPFVEANADVLTLILVGPVFLLAHVWLAWSWGTVPGFVQLPYVEAMQAALAAVPGSPGWTTEAIQAAAFADATQLWLLAFLDRTVLFAALRPLAVGLYLFNTGLVVFSAVQLSLSVMAFFHRSFALHGAESDQTRQ